MKRIKVVSDGTKTGTKIADADTGEQLTNVTSVGIYITPETDHMPRAHLVMLHPSLELVSEIEQVDSEWIDLRRGGERPTIDALCWVAMPGLIALACYQGGIFHANDKPFTDVTHWQYAYFPKHPIEEETAVWLGDPQ